MEGSLGSQEAGAGGLRAPRSNCEVIAKPLFESFLTYFAPCFNSLFLSYIRAFCSSDKSGLFSLSRSDWMPRLSEARRRACSLRLGALRVRAKVAGKAFGGRSTPTRTPEALPLQPTPTLQHQANAHALRALRGHEEATINYQAPSLQLHRRLLPRRALLLLYCAVLRLLCCASTLPSKS